jgi:hypothetical protein
LSKITNVEKEHLKQIVSDCIIQQLTIEESLLYIKDKFKLEISQDYFNYMRASLKKNAEKNLKYLQKGRFVYIQNIFFDRLQEIEYMQKMLWEIVNDNQDKPRMTNASVCLKHRLKRLLRIIMRKWASGVNGLRK